MLFKHLPRQRKLPDELQKKAAAFICLFHTLRSFRHEVSCEKWGITPGERMLALKIFQKMAYALSEKEYESLCKELKDNTPKSVYDYFSDN